MLKKIVIIILKILGILVDILENILFIIISVIRSKAIIVFSFSVALIYFFALVHYNKIEEDFHIEETKIILSLFWVLLPIAFRKYSLLLHEDLFGFLDKIIQKGIKLNLPDNIIYADFTADNMIQNSENQKVETQFIDYDSMDGHTFEYFCADILKRNGYFNVHVTPGSGDQGIDIIAQKDEIKFAIQCKCYQADIGNKAIQEAYAGKRFYECHIAIVMTNSYFTKSAIALADKNGVILWSRDKLNELIKTSTN